MAEMQLLPCPCCGSQARFFKIMDTYDSNYGGEGICCDDELCLTTGLRFACGEDVKPLLAELWNRRSAQGKKVYLVATGETYEGQETYTRHNVLPLLCDFERLWSLPPPPNDSKEANHG